MRGAKTAVLLSFLMITLCLTASTAMAQSTTITNLAYPTSTVSSQSATVTFDLTYAGLTSTDVLIAFIYNPSGNSIGSGSASSSPDQCISLAGTKFSGDAACVWRPNLSSGTEHLTFNLQFSGTHIQTYDFSAAAGAYAFTSAQTGSLLAFTQQSFTVTAGTTYDLTISATYPVTVTVDGSPTASGSIEVTPGVHTVSVPTVVQLDNVSRLSFERWDDGTPQTNRTLNVQTDTTIDAIYARQYLLTLISPSVNATGAGWYDDGDTARYSVPASAPMQGVLGILGSKVTFDGWFENGKLVTASNTGEISMLNAHSLTARWTTDYLMPLIILGVVAAVVVVSLGIYLTRMGRKSKR